MRLWTLQDEDVYNTVMTEGQYRCIASKSECLKDDRFKRAYDWLVTKMEEKLGMVPKGVVYPVWAWLKKPDMRKHNFYPKGMKIYRIQFEIDLKDIFLTDYNLWHFVLNNEMYFDFDPKDYEDVNEWYDTWYAEERKIIMMGRDVYEKAKRESWNVVICDEESPSNRIVQVTFWELKKEQIKKVDIFYRD